ncbi:MAG: hypothetical protein AEth_00573 [Candidatus Argoarchaeum ethanivorans]|uniref:Uncharacterized protein n=1 Tax=Candidatus Argoarchaeum ethanivorans TaxID=2608793 RepID=A0A8B6SDG4_9EURY|nr:MAG: hypothetical protein AEth_00573 [Candidatus Argoarchaeum ethanivorans]
MSNINKPEVTLWILKWQHFLSNFFHLKIVASLFIFYVPIIITGYILQTIYNYRIFTLNIHVALLWIGMAPYIIENAFNYINDFFYRNKIIFLNKDEWKALYFYEMKRIQTSKYFLQFGLPWGIITSFVLSYCLYNNAPIIIQFWSIISFFILFFVSAIGFVGILLLISILNNLGPVSIWGTGDLTEKSSNTGADPEHTTTHAQNRRLRDYLPDCVHHNIQVLINP